MSIGGNRRKLARDRHGDPARRRSRPPGRRYTRARRASSTPRLNGIETCRRLKSEPATADATIVMLTGDAEQAAEVDARRAGADLFLRKPFSPLHLLRLVDRLGHRPGV